MRTLTTIFYADAVEYSRLMGDDESATIRLLNEYREVFAEHIARHDGNFVGSPGDSVLAQFASPVEAVACAVETQRELASRNQHLAGHRQMPFRIGINVGDVMEQNKELQGDGVNIAARLEGLAEPGGLCVSRAVFKHVEGKVPSVNFEDLGVQQLKNIVKPVHAFKARIDLENTPLVSTFSSPSGRKRQSRFAVAAVAACVAVAVAAVVLTSGPRPIAPRLATFLTGNSYPLSEPASGINQLGGDMGKLLTPPGTPSIAVLPFENLSHDPQQIHFSQGITAGIVVELAKISGIFVVARSATLKLAVSKMDQRKLSEELGVQYLLSGTVQKSADAVLITAELVEGATSEALWTFKDRPPVSDVFATQDLVAQEIAKTLGVQLKESEAQNIAGQIKIDTETIDLYFRGRQTFLRISKENAIKSLDLFRQTIKQNDEFAGGYAGLATAKAFLRKLGVPEHVWHKNGEKTAEQLAELAVSYDRTFPDAYLAVGHSKLAKGDHAAAIAAASEAVRIAPGYARPWALLGYFRYLAGKPELAVEAMKTAITRRADYPNIYNVDLGIAYLLSNQYDNAVKRLAVAAERPDGPPFRHLFLAACYAMDGKPEQAKSALKKFPPSFSQEMLKSLFPFKRPEDWNKIMEAARKAGYKG